MDEEIKNESSGSVVTTPPTPSEVPQPEPKVEDAASISRRKLIHRSKP